MLEIQYMLTHWHCAHTHKKSSVIENTELYRHYNNYICTSKSTSLSLGKVNITKIP